MGNSIEILRSFFCISGHKLIQHSEFRHQVYYRANVTLFVSQVYFDVHDAFKQPVQWEGKPHIFSLTQVYFNQLNCPHTYATCFSLT